MEEKRGLEAKSKLYNQWEKEILQENKGVTWSNFFVLMVEKIEKSMERPPEGYTFHCKLYCSTPANSWYVGQDLIWKGDFWEGEKGNKFPSIASYLFTWRDPFKVARSMAEHFFDLDEGQGIVATPLDGVFGRGGEDYAVENWWDNVNNVLNKKVKK